MTFEEAREKSLSMEWQAIYETNGLAMITTIEPIYYDGDVRYYIMPLEEDRVIVEYFVQLHNERLDSKGEAFFNDID
jgi:hypothetical protein